MVRPGVDAFHRAVLGVICAVLFSGMSYIWPWYLLWALAVAALVPASTLARWVLAAAIAFTFVIPIAPIFFSYRQIALPLYGLTLLGIAPVWRRFLPDPGDSRR
jgi:alpha-1,6-mannosyltransferase